MTYTCACYPTAESTLEEAQAAKYELAFRKLGLRAGQRLLDVGCGWGGMVRHAARQGVKALGVTLSREQAAWGQEAIRREGLQDLADPFVRNVPMNPLLAAVFRVAMSGPWARRVWTSYLRNLSPGRRPTTSRAPRRHRREPQGPGPRARLHRAPPGPATRPPRPPRRRPARTLVVMGELDPDFPDPNAEASTSPTGWAGPCSWCPRRALPAGRAA